MKYPINSRLSAFLIHLAICAIIAALALVVVFFVWYPAPLHAAVGVTDIFLMLLAVDVILGPVLTGIVFTPDKPSLKFDLAVIALLQLSALCYGMDTVFEGRPAFVVYNVDRFDITRAHEIDQASAETAKKNNNLNAELSWFKPKWVGAVASPDPKRRQEIMFSSALGGPDWPLLPELYVSLTDVKKQMLQKARPLQELHQLHKGDSDTLSQLATLDGNKVKWVPLRGKVRNMVVLVDANSSEVIKALDIKPWP